MFSISDVVPTGCYGAFAYIINIIWWLQPKALIFQNFLVQNIMAKFRSILFSPNWRNWIVIWWLPTGYLFFQFSFGSNFLLVCNIIFIRFSKIDHIFEFQRNTNMTESTTVLWSDLREFVHKNSNVVIHKICLQLERKKLHLVP